MKDKKNDELRRLRDAAPDVTIPPAPPIEWRRIEESSDEPASGDGAPHEGAPYDEDGVVEIVPGDEVGQRRREKSETSRRWRTAGIAAAAAAALFIGGLVAREFAVGDQTGVAGQSTGVDPSLSAPEQLEQLATLAGGQPALEEGPVRYLEAYTWTSGVGETDWPTLNAEHGRTQIWIAEDGSGKVAKEGADHGGVPIEQNPGTAAAAGTYAAGTFPSMSECREGTVEFFAPDVAPNVSTMQGLGHAVTVTNYIRRCNETEFPMTPVGQEHLVAALADADGVEARGLVTDALGREGLEFAVPVDATFGGVPGTIEARVVLDRQTGSLLGYASVISYDGGPVDGPVNSQAFSSEYVVYESPMYVDEVGELPVEMPTNETASEESTPDELPSDDGETDGAAPGPESLTLEELADIAAAQPEPESAEYRYLRAHRWQNDGSNEDGSPGPEVHGTTHIWIAPGYTGKVVHEPAGQTTGMLDLPAGDYGPDNQLPRWPHCLTGDANPGNAGEANLPAPEGPMTEATSVVFAIVTCNEVEFPLPSTAQAVFLDKLAQTGDVESLGNVTDRLGREGVAFAVQRDLPESAVPGGVEEQTIILDPQTGALLAYQVTLLEADNHPADLPWVQDYRAYEAVGYVDEIGEKL